MGCQVAIKDYFSCIDENTGLQRITGADSVEDVFFSVFRHCSAPIPLRTSTGWGDLGLAWNIIILDLKHWRRWRQSQCFTRNNICITVMIRHVLPRSSWRQRWNPILQRWNWIVINKVDGAAIRQTVPPRFNQELLFAIWRVDTSGAKATWLSFTLSILSFIFFVDNVYIPTIDGILLILLPGKIRRNKKRSRIEIPLSSLVLS